MRAAMAALALALAVLVANSFVRRWMQSAEIRPANDAATDHGTRRG